MKISNLIDNLINVDYEEALRQAIAMRQQGTIDAATDDALGRICYSIVRWALADMVKEQRIIPQLAADADFQAQCLLALVAHLDKVNTNTAPKAIRVYLKKVAQGAARDQRIALNRHKRKHEDVEISTVTIVSDFYGRRCTNETALEY